MERVALDLQNTAHAKRANQEDLDLFGRSAFNRYYYATFLIARKMMLGFNPNWRGNHSSLPQELRTSVINEVRQTLKKVKRVGDKQGEAICQTAISALHDLADLLTNGYSVRVIADYHPDITVAVDSSARFKLDKTDINAAHSWPSKAHAFVQAIERARKLANGHP